MFEALTLRVFEVGLSWKIVFGKREAFQRAFHGFDVTSVSKMTDHDVDRLVEGGTEAPRSIADIPTTTPLARKLAGQLKSQGYRFLGPTSVYAFMQSVGAVNDHIHGCFRAVDYSSPARPGGAD